MKPNAWSHSALDAFENCPRQYYETKIAKRWPFETTKEMEWGKYVHKQFEDYLLGRIAALPLDLGVHQDFLDTFKAQPGTIAGEERIALDDSLQPCAYFGKRVWYRGQVDARMRDTARGYSHILDHKTGKVKTDYAQLKSFAIYEFLTQPSIHTVRCEFYWTQIRGANGETYTRDQLWSLVGEFVPKLDRFSRAFLTNTWNPKQSGLCRGWCPVSTCEFWSPKRPRP